MSEALIALGAFWLAGAAVTTIRIRQISTDTPGGAFLIALIAWPAFWL